MRKLVAALACRNGGSRLYGKPMQNLESATSRSVLFHIVENLRALGCIDQIVLGVSEGRENYGYIEFAELHKLISIVGDQKDVLSRLVQCGDAGGATDILRVTTESPFLYFEPVEEAWREHKSSGLDATFMDHVPDGSGFEIISLAALKKSHELGTTKHRSELCSLFIRENPSMFKTRFLTPPEELNRKDIRLTIDNPEDLIVCREVFKNFKNHSPRIPVSDIVRFLDTRPDLKALIAPFCEAGYATMYVRREERP